MSDTIAYPVGNTKGRDHVYWPIISPAKALSQGLPTRQLGLSLTQMMALSWRVKKWRLAGAEITGHLHQIYEVGGAGAHRDHTINTAFTFPPFDVKMVNNAVREAGLINSFFLTFNSGHRGGLRNEGWTGNSGATVSEITSFHYTTTPPDGFETPDDSGSGTFTSSGGAGVSIQIGSSSAGGFNGVYWNQVSKLFYPEINFAASVSLHYGGQLILRGDMRDISGGGGNLTINPIVASPFSLPLKSSGFIIIPAHPAPTIVTSSAALTMTAVEFWPYKNSLGKPIFNTSTGHPIGSLPYPECCFV